MFEAQMLMATGTGASAYSVFSPWFPRGGNNLRATLELINSAASADRISLGVTTKALDETGDGTDVAGSIDLDGSDVGTVDQRQTGEFAGTLKDLVRYKFTVQGTAGNWVLFRTLAPVWFDDVEA